MRLSLVTQNTKFYQIYNLKVYKMTIKYMEENLEIKKWECLNILNYILQNTNANSIQLEKYLCFLLFKTIGMHTEKDLK